MNYCREEDISFFCCNLCGKEQVEDREEQVEEREKECSDFSLTRGSSRNLQLDRDETDYQTNKCKSIVIGIPKFQVKALFGPTRHEVAAEMKKIDEHRQKVYEKKLRRFEDEQKQREIMSNLKMEVSSRMSSALMQFGRAATELKREITGVFADQKIVIASIVSSFALVLPVHGVLGFAIAKCASYTGWAAGAGADAVVLKEKVDTNIDTIERIVMLCRLYNEKIYEMMSNGNLTERQLLDLRDAYAVENTSLERFKEYIQAILNDVHILDFIGKEKYPFWIDSFQAFALEHTHVCSVTINTPNVKIKRLAVVVWSNNDKKTTRVVHWLHKGLDFMVTDHKNWIEKDLVVGSNVAVGGVPWYWFPLRFFDTNVDIDEFLQITAASSSSSEKTEEIGFTSDHSTTKETKLICYAPAKKDEEDEPESETAIVLYKGKTDAEKSSSTEPGTSQTSGTNKDPIKNEHRLTLVSIKGNNDVESDPKNAIVIYKESEEKKEENDMVIEEINPETREDKQQTSSTTNNNDVASVKSTVDNNDESSSHNDDPSVTSLTPAGADADAAAAATTTSSSPPDDAFAKPVVVKLPNEKTTKSRWKRLKSMVYSSK